MPRPREVCDDCFLRAVDSDESPVRATKEVAETLGYSSQGVANRLHELAEAGLISETQKGGTQLWYLERAGFRQLTEQYCDCDVGFDL